MLNPPNALPVTLQSQLERTGRQGNSLALVSDLPVDLPSHPYTPTISLSLSLTFHPPITLPPASLSDSSKQNRAYELTDTFLPPPLKGLHLTGLKFFLACLTTATTQPASNPSASQSLRQNRTKHRPREKKGESRRKAGKGHEGDWHSERLGERERKEERSKIFFSGSKTLFSTLFSPQALFPFTRFSIRPGGRGSALIGVIHLSITL